MSRGDASPKRCPYVRAVEILMEGFARLQPPTMPRAIIAPSVLASDFGQLTAECKRMIKGGAEWLHMGMFLSLSSPHLSHCLQTSWTGDSIHFLGFVAVFILYLLSAAISCQVSPSVRLSSIDWCCVIDPCYSLQVPPSSPVSARAFQASSWTAI